MELRKVTWSNIFQRVRFLVQVVHDALPSPANLQARGKGETLPASFFPEEVL